MAAEWKLKYLYLLVYRVEAFMLLHDPQLSRVSYMLLFIPLYLALIPERTLQRHFLPPSSLPVSRLHVPLSFSFSLVITSKFNYSSLVRLGAPVSKLSPIWITFQTTNSSVLNASKPPPCLSEFS